MPIFSGEQPQYSILDLGYNRSLTKVTLAEQGFEPLSTPEMGNVFTSGTAPKNILAGELLTDVAQNVGTLFNGKTAFDNTVTGYILGVDTSDDLLKFYIGNTTSYLNWTGTALNIAGTLTASEIHIPDTTTANSFHTDSDGNSWWGATTLAASVASVTNAGAGTFSNVTITGGSIASTPISSIPNNTSTDLSLLEFSHSLVFSVTDADTIAWAAGTIVMSNGRSFSIDAGNTGNMSALTYIYLDTGVSSTVLQTTITYSTAMGANKVLLGMARNNTVTASFIPRGGGQPLIDGGNIGALSIVAGNIAASTITSDKISVSQLSAISADMGSLTAGTITGATIRTSATDPRIELTSSQMIMTNGAGVSQISFVPSSGAISFAHATISRDGVPLTIQNSTDSASVQVAQFGSGTRAVPADNDNGYIGFNCNDDLGASVEFARMYWGALDVTSTTKDSTFTFHTYANNVLAERFDIDNQGVHVTGNAEVTGTFTLGATTYPNTLASALRILISDGVTGYVASTASYPDTVTANSIIYASATNVISDLAVINSAVLCTTSAGTPSLVGSMTNGQLIIGSTSATPVRAALTAGSGITITNGAGSITVASGTRLGTATTNVTVGSPSAEQGTTETNIISVSIPANTLGTTGGVRVRLHISDFEIAAQVNQTFTLRFKYGTTTVATAVLTRPATAITGTRGYVEALLIAAGATNSQEGSVIFHAASDPGAGVDAVIERYGAAEGTAAEDSTGALNVVISGQWAVIEGNNHITMAHGIVEQII